MKTTKIEMTPNSYRDGLESSTVLSLKGTYHRFAVGAVPVGSEGRKVTDGPMVPGPWAYAAEMCTMITDEGIPTDRSGDVEVEEGTRLEIDGVVYEVRVDRGQWIELEEVKTGNEWVHVLADLNFQWDAKAECYTHLKFGTRVDVYFERGRPGNMVHVIMQTAEEVKSKATFTSEIPTDAVLAFIKTVAMEVK